LDLRECPQKGPLVLGSCHRASHRYCGGRGGAFWSRPCGRNRMCRHSRLRDLCALRGFAIASDIYIEPLTPPCPPGSILSSRGDP
jgi:hypothetical protein